MGLCGLRALRGLCGFCVREWLGGFGACGVFALVFFFFALIFHSFALLLSSCFASCPFTFFALVVFACPLALSFLLCLCVFLFPYGLYAKKGAIPCVLSCPVVCVSLVLCALLLAS